MIWTPHYLLTVVFLAGFFRNKIRLQTWPRILSDSPVHHALLLHGLECCTAWESATISHWPFMDYFQKQLESWLSARKVILHRSVPLLPMLHGYFEVRHDVIIS